MQAVPFQRLQGGIETGRLHHHRVTRPGHRLQAQVQRFQRAVGDDDLLRRHLHAGNQVTQGDLPAQLDLARRQIVHRAPRIQRLRGRGHRPPKLVQRIQQRTGEGRSQRHHVVRHRRFQHLEHQFAHVHRTRAVGRLRGAFGFRRQRQGVIGHVVARARARADQAARLQQVIGLEHRGRTDFAAGTGLPDRRQALARPQQALADGAGDVLGQGFVALHSSPFQSISYCLNIKSDPVFRQGF